MYHPEASLVPKYHEQEAYIQLVVVAIRANPEHHHLVRYRLGCEKSPFMTGWIDPSGIVRLLQSKGITYPPYGHHTLCLRSGTQAWACSSRIRSRTRRWRGLGIFSFGSGPNTSASPGAGAFGDGSDLAPRRITVRVTRRVDRSRLGMCWMGSSLPKRKR